MLIHGQTYLLNTGILVSPEKKIIKTIPGMPGCLAVAFSNQLVIYSLDSGTVAVQDVSKQISSLDVSEINLHGNSVISFLVGCEDKEIKVFNLKKNSDKYTFEMCSFFLPCKNAYSSQHLSKPPSGFSGRARGDSSLKIISMNILSLGSENYLAALIKNGFKQYEVLMVNIKNYKAHHVMLAEAITCFSFNELKVFANDNGIHIYLMNMLGEFPMSGGCFCLSYYHPLDLNLEAHATLKHTSIIVECSRGILKTSLHFNKDNKKVSLLSCGEITKITISSYPIIELLGEVVLSLDIVPDAKYLFQEDFIDLDSFSFHYSCFSEKDVSYIPILTSGERSIFLKLSYEKPFLFKSYDYSKLEIGYGRKTAQLEKINWCTQTFDPKVPVSDFFCDVIYQDDEPFVLFGDVGRGLQCLNLKQLEHPPRFTLMGYQKMSVRKSAIPFNGQYIPNEDL